MRPDFPAGATGADTTGTGTTGTGTETVDRRRTPRGELALRRSGGHFEIISNGVFLMDTRDGRSEQLLVRAALDACPAPAPTVLIGGLGAGFSLATAQRDPRVATITVVEVEDAVIGWHARWLGAVTGCDPTDPRVRVIHADLGAWLRTAVDRYDVICLDVDNGPDWTVTPGNATLYDGGGLHALRDRLEPGGVLAVWSANRSPAFEARLAAHVGTVATREVPVPRGCPDVVYVARTPLPGSTG